jgi:phage terminase large subunit-like protein
VCFSNHEYDERAVSAKRGEAGFDDQFFAYACGLDEGDDPFEDETCWVKSNPNLGISVTADYLRKQVREAKGIPGKASLVRRLNFCEWTESSDPWMDGPTWRACEVDEVDLSGREVFAGLDLSGARDLTAAAFVTIDGEGMMHARVEFWTPGDTLRERLGANQPPWDAWVGAGHVHAPPGRVIRYDAVAQRLLEIAAQCNLVSVGYDEYHIKFFELELQRMGVTLPLVSHPQGGYRSKDSLLWMPRSIELLETRLLEKSIRIEKNPCLWWNSQSAALATDLRGNRTFAKKFSRGRIDGVVALAMAVGVAGGVEAIPASVYETRGILSFDFSSANRIQPSGQWDDDD